MLFAKQPLIPTHILDPAQQRFYVTAFYVLLWAWKLYDRYLLGIEEVESFWMFMKWSFIDACFIFGVPLLDIPWLQWSNAVAVLFFAGHTAVDWMLMYRVGIPFATWAVSLFGFLFDSEMAISERSVKQNAIIHNASLILGKQIINILPEGYVLVPPARRW